MDIVAWRFGASVRPILTPLRSCIGCWGPAALQIRAKGSNSRHGRTEHHKFGQTRTRGRWYYRFHKQIGKANWRKYVERFIAPRKIENTQRFRPTPFATYRMSRHSHSWYWRLPKSIADATTADEVLTAWIQFRHKLPKKTYHHFKVLKRLVDVGGCDAADWRFRFITSRLHSIHYKVLNLPRLLHYYSLLRARHEMETAVKFVYKMIPRYTNPQVCLTAQAFGHAKIQDKYLFGTVASALGSKMETVSARDLVRLAQSFAATEICNYDFLSKISAQAQLRVQQAATEAYVPGMCPNLGELAEIAQVFAKLRFQDYSYFEMISVQVQRMLREGLPGPTPPIVAQFCDAFRTLRIHDIHFFETVLGHAGRHWYDYDATSLARIGAAVSLELPRGLPPVRRAYERMFAQLRQDQDLLSLEGIGMAARFMSAVDRKPSEEFTPGFSMDLVRRLMELREEPKEKFDVPRVLEIFAARRPDDGALFSSLCRHVHRHLALFEPADFVRAARGLSKSEYRDERVTHAMAKWAQKRCDEFTTFDWQRFLESLGAMGFSEHRLDQMRRLPSQSGQLPASSNL